MPNGGTCGTQAQEALEMAVKHANRGGRGLFVMSLPLVVLVSGCMSEQLRFSALRTMSTLPDLHYQQVVDNLAKIAANPGFLPYLAVAGHGTVQVTDNGTSTLGFNFRNKIYGPGTIGITSTRNITGTWSMGTVTSPEKLRSMQAVYLRALRGVQAGDPAFAWLKFGRKEDVPQQATHVGRHETSYAWVMPQGVDGLSELTLAILDIATSEDAGGLAGPESGPLRGAAGPSGVPRRNFQVPPAGPVFTPGTH
jgi:hypothetical protein